MAVAVTNLTNGNTNNSSSVNTASVSPGANKLITVTVVNARNGQPATLPTISGASMTWTQVNTVTANTNSWRGTIFRGLSASPGSGALTISFGGTSQDAGILWYVNEFSGTKTTGTNGADAIVQSATNVATGTNSGITVTLSAFGNSNNAAYGYCATQGSSPTVGSGFTLISTQTSVSVRSINEFKNSQDTTVDFSWGSVGTQGHAIAIEIAASLDTSRRRALLGVGL